MSSPSLVTKSQIRCALHSACNTVKPFLQQFTLVLSMTNITNYLHSHLFAQSAFGRDLLVIRYIAAPGIIIPCCYRCWRCTSVACVSASSRMTIRQVWTGCLLYTTVDACSALDDAMRAVLLLFSTGVYSDQTLACCCRGCS